MPIILPSSAKNARKQKRVGAPIRTPRSIEVEYRRALLELNRATKNSTKLIGRAIRDGATRAEAVRLVEQQIAESRARYQAAANQLPGSVTQAMSTRGKEQVQNMVKRSLGVDFATIVDNELIGEELEVAKMRNARLIQTISEEHWGRVVQAVSDSYAGRSFEEGSLTKRLQKIGGISDSRARVIARDQTAKLSTDLARIRQEEVGIVSYIWRNSQDNRVVGKPGGLYPTGNSRHRNHWEREGKEFRWDSPPPDGHPGQAILCRCRAEPVIDIGQLNATYV